jgi:hypothetical protein
MFYFVLCRTDGSDIEYCFMTEGADPKPVTYCYVGDTTEPSGDTTVDSGDTTSDSGETTAETGETTENPDITVSSEETSKISGNTTPIHLKATLLQKRQCKSNFKQGKCRHELKLRIQVKSKGNFSRI